MCPSSLSDAPGSAQPQSCQNLWGLGGFLIPAQIQLFSVTGLNLSLTFRGDKSEPQTAHFRKRSLNEIISHSGDTPGGNSWRQRQWGAQDRAEIEPHAGACTETNWTWVQTGHRYKLGLAQVQTGHGYKLGLAQVQQQWEARNRKAMRKQNREMIQAMQTSQCHKDDTVPSNAKVN